MGQGLSCTKPANKSGAFTSANLASIEAAADSLGASGETSILNSPSPGAYPISTFTWLVYRSELDPGKREAILRFAEWMLDSGQRSCASLGYAPLPPALAERERVQVHSELQVLR